jgi:dTDP-4-dehydrorhamnose 3,5-epimerase
MKLVATKIPDCFEIEFVAHRDARGSFVKSFQASAFRELGLEAAFTESFYSTSAAGVLRGMHFQLPPTDGAKLVYCLQGAVFDVALDLRIDSPVYGQSVSFNLSQERATAVYIPRGVAHGFFVSDGPATLGHNISSEYDAALDAGVLWNSFGMCWPEDTPLLSERDRRFRTLAEFDSPFRFAPTEVKI